MPPHQMRLRGSLFLSGYSEQVFHNPAIRTGFDQAIMSLTDRYRDADVACVVVVWKSATSEVKNSRAEAYLYLFPLRWEYTFEIVGDLMPSVGVKTSTD